MSMNDIERQSFWTTELEQSLSKKCIHCGSFDLERHGELEYNDGSSEPNTSNHLVMVYHYVCQDCGDITPE